MCVCVCKCVTEQYINICCHIYTHITDLFKMYLLSVHSQFFCHRNNLTLSRRDTHYCGWIFFHLLLNLECSFFCLRYFNLCITINHFIDGWYTSVFIKRLHLFACSNEKTFLLDFLENLEQMFPRYL